MMHRTPFFLPVSVVVLVITMTMGSMLHAETRLSPDELSRQLQQKRTQREALERSAAELRARLESEQKKSVKLETQLAIVADRRSAVEAEIDAKKIEIEEKDLVLADLTATITAQESDIATFKDHIAALLVALRTRDDEGSIMMLVGFDSFSEFFDRARSLEAVHTSVGHTLGLLQDANVVVRRDHDAAEQARAHLTILKGELDHKRTELGEQETNTEYLLTQTRLSEDRYGDLLADARREQQNAEAEVQALERQLREQLALRSIGGGNGFVWPVDPSRGLTALFHDPSYLFRTIFEHPAIDIRAGQGTPIKAAGGGIVGIARDAGLGYSYVLLLHDNNLSTVYGHMSRIDVREGESVAQGQVIGLSGGRPGTAGAGRLTTGPHLHFEVRKNGVPVDPLGFLPR